MSMMDRTQLEKTFNKFDADGNGTIDFTELLAALRQSGKDPTDDQVRKVIAAINTKYAGLATEAQGKDTLNLAQFQKVSSEYDQICDGSEAVPAAAAPA